MDTRTPAPQPLGQLDRCWVSPESRGSNGRRGGAARGRSGGAQAGHCSSGPAQTLGGAGEGCAQRETEAAVWDRERGTPPLGRHPPGQ